MPPYQFLFTPWRNALTQMYHKVYDFLLTIYLSINQVNPYRPSQKTINAHCRQVFIQGLIIAQALGIWMQILPSRLTIYLDMYLKKEGETKGSKDEVLQCSRGENLEFYSVKKGEQTRNAINWPPQGKLWWSTTQGVAGHLGSEKVQKGLETSALRAELSNSPLSVWNKYVQQHSVNELTL